MTNSSWNSFFLFFSLIFSFYLWSKQKYNRSLFFFLYMYYKTSARCVTPTRTTLRFLQNNVRYTILGAWTKWEKRERKRKKKRKTFCTVFCFLCVSKLDRSFHSSRMCTHCVCKKEKIFRPTVANALCVS